MERCEQDASGSG